MKLSKAMIRIFADVIRGRKKIKELAEAEDKSQNRVTEILKDLEKEGLIIKKKSYNLKNSRIIIEPAQTSHALRFKELLIQYQSIKFEEILADSRILFLSALTDDWMSIDAFTALSKTSKYAVERFRPKLINKGVIIRKRNLYKLNEKAWPLLKDFLTAYKNYSDINGYVKWKYQDEIIFEVKENETAGGSLTGLSAYRDYGIKVNTITSLYYLPEKKLSKQEIFVHSLFEINDPRTLYLAMAFFIKNKLEPEAILGISMKYGKYTAFEDFMKIIKSSEEKVNTEKMPPFSRKDFKRVAHIYSIENV